MVKLNQLISTFEEKTKVSKKSELKQKNSKKQVEFNNWTQPLKRHRVQPTNLTFRVDKGSWSQLDLRINEIELNWIEQAVPNQDSERNTKENRVDASWDRERSLRRMNLKRSVRIKVKLGNLIMLPDLWMYCDTGLSFWSRRLCVVGGCGCCWASRWSISWFLVVSHYDGCWVPVVYVQVLGDSARPANHFILSGICNWRVSG